MNISLLTFGVICTSALLLQNFEIQIEPEESKGNGDTYPGNNEINALKRHKGWGGSKPPKPTKPPKPPVGPSRSERITISKAGNASAVPLVLLISMGVVEHLGVPAARLPPYNHKMGIKPQISHDTGTTKHRATVPLKRYNPGLGRYPAHRDIYPLHISTMEVRITTTSYIIIIIISSLYVPTEGLEAYPKLGINSGRARFDIFTRIGPARPVKYHDHAEDTRQALWAAAAALPEIYDLDAFQDENQEGRLLRERREPQLFWNSHSDGSDLNDDLDDGRNGLHNGGDRSGLTYDPSLHDSSPDQAATPSRALDKLT
ncbi:hypothetical protein RR46_01006 [Papilio xuthus]|uniref:Uncharacterized protein n=1 Tax=Papilio xuthus TaxID=66420 RepID=A0A0N0PA10_PAPXU|nr:hypothetical protein RR46_01006 [Papilio xuthus]